MNMIAIIELQMLGEHIKYLHDKNCKNQNDGLIKIASEAYKALAGKIIDTNT